MHHFNNPEYAVNSIHPVYNPKIDNISSVLNNDNYVKSMDTTVVAQLKNETKKVGAGRNKREHVSHIGTPPPMSHKTLKQTSTIENTNLETDESDLDNDFMILNYNTKVSNTSTETDTFNLTADEIVSAMNGAPSPPKFALSSEISTSTLTNISTSKTKRHLPPPCLKQTKNMSNNASANTPALYNSALVKETIPITIDNLNTSHVSPVSGSNLKISQSQSPVPVVSTRIRPPPQYAEAIEQLKRSTNTSSSDAVVNTDIILSENLNIQQTPTQPQGLKSQLNQSNQAIQNIGNTSALSSQQIAIPKVHQHIYSKSNSSQKNKPIYNIQEKEQQKSIKFSQKYIQNQTAVTDYQTMRIPSSAKSIQGCSNTKNTFDANLQHQQDKNFQQQQPNYEQKQWQNLSNQPQFLMPFSQKENYQLKYGSVVEGSSSNLETFYPFQLAKSEPKLNYEVNFLILLFYYIKKFKEHLLNNNVVTFPPQKRETISLLPVINSIVESCKKQIPQRRYASRSPALNRGINRVKSMPSASTYGTVKSCLNF